MYLSNESLLVILFVGIIAGWLAGKIVDGGGFGLIGDLAVGIIGAFIGDWLLPRLHVQLGTGIVSAILNATIGAIVLLVIVRAIAGARYYGGGGNGGGWGWRGRWGGRWY
ncbi:MAG TPA: GlsB/YeaQ/YmgE family stress response membrane protein [Stellaceae bacterium]|nr:GlsB/YeaQ/YmgE family stress response membrane protein [Stellaceae bacterium]